eukprot:TRINITY_DN40208_c0_g1_i1.p1 TRINITY_DN40208_c0_g1~~TRINITY_DN40208_c0_g1_i1.p1  ORF type:complete len:1153 (+),score=149.71 TRINITY_DN40208_c0_g1_i1:131-3589(+)
MACVPRGTGGGPSSFTTEAPASSCASWEDLQSHTAYAAGSWVFLGLLGVILASIRWSWDAERVERLLRGSASFFTMSTAYLIPAVGISLFMCFLHLLRILDAGVSSLLDDIELYACYVHALELLVLWLFSAARSLDEVSELFFGRLLIDCAVVSTVLVRRHASQNGSAFSFSYVSSLRSLILWRLHLRLRKSSLKSHLLEAVFTLAAFIFCIACFVMQVETLVGQQWYVTTDTWSRNETGPSGPAHLRWTMTSSVYFVFTTCTTVGFNDFYPRSLAGQCVMVVVGSSGAFVLLRAALGIAQAVEIGLVGGGVYQTRKRAKHIVVAGGPSFDVLKTFLEELYHDDHSQEAEDLNTVIMLLPGERQTMNALKVYLRQHRHLLHRVWLIHGSALKRDDLDRVSYAGASLGFVLPNISASDREREDLENVMRALSMTTHTKYIRVVTILLQADHRDLMLAAGVARNDIVCLDEIKLGLLGKSCDAQGFIPFVCTLLRCSGEFIMPQLAEPLHWLEHYTLGLENEFYEQKLSPAYEGAPFGDVALNILDLSDGGAYLVGLVEEPLFPSDQTIIRLFPGRYYRVATDTKNRSCNGVFIARDRSSIKQHTPDSQFKWSLGGRVRVVETGAAHPHVPEGEAGAIVVTEWMTPHGKIHLHRTPGKQGWVLDPWKVSEEHDQRVERSMRSAAEHRASVGLLAHADMSAEEVERLVGAKVHGSGQRDSLMAEDEAEQAAEDGDEARQVLLAEHTKIRRQAANEADALANEARLKEEAKKKAVSVRVVRKAEKANEVYEATTGEHISERDKEDDDALWGGPPHPPPPLYGEPVQPPTDLLLRGGHVLFLAIECQTNSTSRAGQRLGLQHFLRALRATDQIVKRPVVVLASRVPLDWPRFAAEGEVYFVVGQPLSATNLHSAAICLAHSVVIHQDGRVMGKDSSTLDSEAVFACRVVDSILSEANHDIRVICDLTVEKNCNLVPLSKHERKKHNAAKVIDDDDDDEERLNEGGGNDLLTAFNMKTRFIVGQLFSSNVVVSMAANMLYNPTLGALVQELVHARVLVAPLPEEWRGHTFRQLFEHVLRRRNLLVVALLRCQDEHVETRAFYDDLEEDDFTAKTTGSSGKVDDESWRRYIYTMPAGNRIVSGNDGMLCILPSCSVALV